MSSESSSRKLRCQINDGERGLGCNGLVVHDATSFLKLFKFNVSRQGLVHYDLIYLVLGLAH
jgi:hypothetical protein